MSFSKFLMEQQAEKPTETTARLTHNLKEGGNLGGSLEDQLRAQHDQLEELLGNFLQTLKTNQQEWDNLTDTTGYFPPKSKVSSAIWTAQREINDALDHFQYMQSNNDGE